MDHAAYEREKASTELRSLKRAESTSRRQSLFGGADMSFDASQLDLSAHAPSDGSPEKLKKQLEERSKSEAAMARREQYGKDQLANAKQHVIHVHSV